MNGKFSEISKEVSNKITALIDKVQNVEIEEAGYERIETKDMQARY